VQTCSLCNASSPDQASHCVNCKADLAENSTIVQALKRFQANSRVKAVTVASSYNACSYCSEQLGTYPVDKVPPLPHKGCSHSNGCRCFFIPVLNDIYP
jgi:hypothetical protein